jgi:putative membrane protein
MKPIGTIPRQHIATGIAILFHLIGVVGILFLNRNFFIGTSFINLLLMFFLIIFTAEHRGKALYIFFIICFITGMTVELVGTKTGMLFGDYSYGKVLGPALQGVPLIIGINWFIMMYCCGTTIHALLQKIINSMPGSGTQPKPVLKVLSVVVDGATLAVAFDWLMEPVAVNLGYWTWHGNGEIPFFNYACWFAVSVPLLYLFHRMPIGKTNKFAIHLLLIQTMFFLLLRTFL